MDTVVFLSVATLGCAIMAGLNLYQAVTGRRLSNAPSRRDESTLRRQSLVAALVLGVVAALGLFFVAYEYCLTCTLSS